MKEKMVAICLLAVLLCSSVLIGCSDDNIETNSGSEAHSKELQNIEHVGQIPDGLKHVVKDNLFKDITAFDGRLLKTEICSVNEENKSFTQKVQLMDIYGNTLASHTISADDAYCIRTLTATDDGGFLFVLGFEDYAYGQGEWASDKGFASRIIKCDKDGNRQFDTIFDSIEGSALSFCFEKNGKFYFFGTIQTAETKTQGVHSYTDVYLSILDEKGSVLKSQCIAGSDYDSLNAVEYTDKGFWLSISSQSCDGDFAGSNSNGYPASWVVTVNDDLEITEKKKTSGRDGFDVKIGELEGRPVYKSDDLLKKFDAGRPTSFIDYGDFYLIVSENITGQYENQPPVFSSIWCYTETVYSGYDKSGNLIFRTAVDSSPDYDAWAQKFNSIS